MFGTLFLKECKQILKSLVYYIYIVVLVLFLSSQLSDSEWTDELKEPKPGQEFYGMTESHDERAVMGETLRSLFNECRWDSYATYPFGFYKGVKLSEKENQQITEIVEKFTGKTIAQLEQDEIDYYESFETEEEAQSYEAYQNFRIEPAADVTYQEFEQAMQKVVKLIGKGSNYEGDLLARGAGVRMSYEQAQEEYQALCEVDRGTGAYMRLFCDYAGIILLFMPIFLGATRVLRDKRAQATQVIYARSISSAKLVLSRYLANVLMAFLPVVVVAYLIQSPFVYQMKTLGMEPDYLAFLKYSVVWLLPTILFILALSFLLGELLENVLAVIVQMFISLGGLFAMDTLVGNFGLKMSVRWNTLGATTKFFEQRQEFLFNRGFYTLLSLLCILLAMFVYEKKRKEGVNLYAKIFKTRH